jgi:pimeloyl-ACP methyl ester carboxylesterase
MSDQIERFLGADTRDRLRIVREPASRDALRSHLGDDAWREYQELARRVDKRHLGPKAAANLLFVPGVMGSLLQSDSKGGVWWIDVRALGHIDDLALSPDGLHDRDVGDAITPNNVDISYEPFLTAALQRPDFEHRTFPYDWRKPLTASAKRLADRVADMYADNGKRPVHLVGHSMGGLMIRAALMEQGQRLWPMVGRIVFIATPHYGSPAIAGYLKNHLWGFEFLALLGRYLSRPTFRSLWGVLAMLPAPRGIYPGTRDNDPEPWRGKRGDPYVHPCANFDLYNAADWHLDLDPSEERNLQTVLDGAREFHESMHAAHRALTQAQLDSMAIIAGVGHGTLFRLAFAKRFFGLWERAEKQTKRVPGDRHREGDGRVPVASAQLDGVRINYVEGVHGGLPNLPVVHNAAFEFLNGGDIALPQTPAQALRRHLAADTTNPAPTLDGSAWIRDDAGNAGMWRLDVDEQALNHLQAELERGGLPAFQYVKLL